MKIKKILATTLVLALCLSTAGCSILTGGGSKKKKDKDEDIDPPSDRTVIKAVEAEYDGEWELECEDGATAVVTWSEGDDEDDLDIDIDDSDVVVETEPDPTPTPTPTPVETEPVETVAEYPEALNGLEQYIINDYLVGVNSICWEGCDMENGIAIYQYGSDIELTFNSIESDKVTFVADIFCYPLSNDNDPDANQDMFSEEYLVGSFELTPDANGNYSVVVTDNSDEESIYIAIDSDEAMTYIDYSYFYTACFVDADGAFYTAN